MKLFKNRGKMIKNHNGLYAMIFVNEGNKLEVTDDWTDAQNRMKGRPHLLKKVHSKFELYEWVNSITAYDIWRARHFGGGND